MNESCLYHRTVRAWTKTTVAFGTALQKYNTVLYFWYNWFVINSQNNIDNHSGNLGADRNPQQAARGQAPSSKLWTGETDMQISNLNLTLYTLNFASPDPSI